MLISNQQKTANASYLVFALVLEYNYYFATSVKLDLFVLFRNIHSVLPCKG